MEEFPQIREETKVSRGKTAYKTLPAFLSDVYAKGCQRASKERISEGKAGKAVLGPEECRRS